MVLINTTMIHPKDDNKSLCFVIPVSLRNRYQLLDWRYILLWNDYVGKYTNLY